MDAGFLKKSEYSAEFIIMAIVLGATAFFIKKNHDFIVENKQPFILSEILNLLVLYFSIEYFEELRAFLIKLAMLTDVALIFLEYFYFRKYQSELSDGILGKLFGMKSTSNVEENRDLTEK